MICEPGCKGVSYSLTDMRLCSRKMKSCVTMYEPTEFFHHFKEIGNEVDAVLLIDCRFSFELFLHVGFRFLWRCDGARYRKQEKWQ